MIGVAFHENRWGEPTPTGELGNFAVLRGGTSAQRRIFPDPSLTWIMPAEEAEMSVVRNLLNKLKLTASLAMAALVAAACAGTATQSATDVTTEILSPPSECFDDAGLPRISAADVAAEPALGTKLTLVTYNSFAVSEGILEAFEAETGIEVDVLTSGDTGSLVSQAVLTVGNPVGDVMWGIDNTFLCAGLEADIFLPYQSPHLVNVADPLKLDAKQRVTPVNFSDVCANYWIDGLVGEPPADIAELARPRYAAEFVTENPETSPPGMGFLLATIARFGEEGWEDYWQELADNGVTVTSGWTEAYFGEFVAGGGDRAIVMSYASSPVAEVLFADPPVDVPPTAVLLDSCFRSIEFAGVLNGTENPGAAARLVDFLLSPTFQEDIPLNMFVYSANDLAQLPEVFTQWGPLSDNPLTLPPDQIQANRDRWTQRWTEIVLR